MCSLNCMNNGSVVFNKYQHVTDRQSDGQTELLYQYRALYSCTANEKELYVVVSYHKHLTPQYSDPV